MKRNKPPKEYELPCEEEILAAIGELIVSQLKGHDELAHALFETLAPQFVGYYPHHKTLAHLLLQYVEEESMEAGSCLEVTPGERPRLKTSKPGLTTALLNLPVAKKSC
jgi:hypothetical protein